MRTTRGRHVALDGELGSGGALEGGRSGWAFIGVGEGVADGGGYGAEGFETQTGTFAQDAWLFGVDGEFGPWRGLARGYYRQRGSHTGHGR
jgi:hypothetical protein